jgi:hypothetical protein
MRDIDRVPAAGEPPRRTLDQRLPRRGRRLSDPAAPPPSGLEGHGREGVDASIQDGKRCGTLDVRV